MAAKHFDHKELATLLLNIAITNTFNRLNAPTRQRTGGFAGTRKRLVIRNVGW